MKTPDTFFRILVLAPFAPLSTSPQLVSAGTVDGAIELFSPEMWVPVTKELCPEGGILLKPARMKDFTPDGMAETVPYLKALADGASFVADASARGTPPGEIADTLRARLPELPLDLSYRPSPARRDERHPSAQNAVDDILAMVAMPQANEREKLAEKGEDGPQAWIAGIQSLLSRLLEEIFADEGFRVWEAAWQGLRFLSRKGPAGEGKDTRLMVVSVTHETPPAVLDELLDRLAPDPPDLILVDLPFTNSPVHIEAMEKIALFAETLCAPAAVWLTPGFFNMEDWGGLKGLPYLGTYVDDAAYAKWRNLCGSSEARWLFATCNRFLVRFPYGEEVRPRVVSFRERSLPWVSPVFAVGTLAARSVAAFGAPWRFTESEKVRIEDCALAELGGGVTAATEVVIPLDRMKQFIRVGISPLMGVAMRDVAFMPLARSASGESMPLQIFFSCLLGFLIRLRDMTGPSPDGLSLRVKEALALFFKSGGQSLPEDLKIDAGEVTPEGLLPLDLSFTPPQSVAVGSGRLSLHFMW